MTLPRLISFSGKKGCGKSLLASICKEQFGYTRISFANNLKLLTCQCLDITLNELNRHKDDVIKPIKINNYNIIYKQTGIHLDVIKEKLSDKYFNSYREILQFIGTDLIRDYNKNWHIDKIKQLIENKPDTKFVLDDSRFINEIELVKHFKGVTFYIINNKDNNIDSHISENEITKSICDFTLINDFNDEFTKNFITLMSNE